MAVYFIKFTFLAYEYVPDSEIASSIVATSLTTGQSGSEEDLLSPKVNIKFNKSNNIFYRIILNVILNIKIDFNFRKLLFLTLI